VNPNKTPFFHSIRTRLVIVSIVIEVTMLGLLIANSLRLPHKTFINAKLTLPREKRAS